MIVATAGHVDHGKTALVRALTGVDTDRLPEERARGMTIDLGFAYRPLAGGTLLGFVDVPGHERFVRNMVAGACGVDFALLVVAADDGPMPQTREHVAILDLLGIGAGAVAVTKIDRVDPERRHQVVADVAALLAGTTLAGAPIFETSTASGDGIAALSEHLDAAARHHSRRATAGRFRLAVDRCFVLRGVGVVATGAVFAGTLHAGDALTVAPAGLAARARSLRIHDRAVEAVAAGERCAVTLSGVERVALGRGDWLVAAGACRPTRRLDVRLRLLPAGGGRLRHWMPAHLHLGAADVPCRIATARGEPDPAGFATLVLERPVVAAAGDRFVLRDPSARRTIGGGRVLDPFAAVRVADKAARRLRLEALDAANAAAAFGRLIALARDGLDLDWFADAWNLTAAEEHDLPGRDAVAVCDAGGRRIAFALNHWQSLLDRISDALDRHHAGHPHSIGPDETSLLAVAAPRAAPEAARQAVVQLIALGAVRRAGVRVHRADHRVAPTAAELQLWHLIEPALLAGDVRPPRVVELAAATGLDRGAIEAFLVRAEELGWVERVARNRFYLPDAVHKLGGIAATLAQSAADRSFSVAEFNRAAGIGRNLTIEVLEHLDRAGITRRIGERRHLAATEPGRRGR